jgi:hypothetical protein
VHDEEGNQQSRGKVHPQLPATTPPKAHPPTVKPRTMKDLTPSERLLVE